MGQAMLKMRRVILAGVGLCLAVSTASAQDAPSPPISWRFQVTPYIWGTAIEGDLGLGPVGTECRLPLGEGVGLAGRRGLGAAAAQAREQRGALLLAGEARGHRAVG